MNKTILIIDDDMTFQRVMKDKLISLKYNVLCANNGEDGFNQVISGKPDLILLDIRMPKIDGMEFLRKIKTVPEIPDIPILITSNLSTMDYISEGVTLGVRGYIVKSNEKLENIVKEIDVVLFPKTQL